MTNAPRTIDRRSFLMTMAAAPAFMAAGQAFAADSETAALHELYEAAIQEGGRLIVYAGGDTPQQQDDVKSSFSALFPKIAITSVVDYSKFHDVRIDNQFATGTVIPDVVHLQTLQDFTRWKDDGRLEAFKPEGFEQIHESFKDPEGAWVGIEVLAFSFMYSAAAAADKQPKNPKDLASIDWKGKIASSYPHDDDAVLFLYKRYVETYGWDWLAEMAKQNIQFARGTHSPELALSQGEKLIGIGAAGSLTSNGPIQWTVGDDYPFLGWAQRGAILKGAKNISAAKLYISWLVSTAVQKASWNGWSVRRDVRPEGNLRPIWDYPTANIVEFVAFMHNRAEVEHWKQTFALYFGEVQGRPSPGWLGLRPGGA